MGDVRWFVCFHYFLFSLQPVSNADFIVPVEIDGIIHQVSISKNLLHLNLTAEAARPKAFKTNVFNEY